MRFGSAGGIAYFSFLVLLFADETDLDIIIRNESNDYSNSVIKLVKQMTAQYVEDLLGTFRERGIDLKTGSPT